MSQTATDESRAAKAHDAKFRIFLSYRRDDAPAQVGRLWADLGRGTQAVDGFAKDTVFKDVETIEPGVDFRQAIASAVEVADVFLSVVGPKWLSITGEDGERRLDDPGDYVRLELAAALERAAEHDDIRIVPLLVGGAEMPGVRDLPTELHEFAHRNAVELTDARWDYDVEQLLRWLKELARRHERSRWRRIAAAVRLPSRRVAAIAGAGILVAVVAIAVVLLMGPSDSVWERVADDALGGPDSQVVNTIVDREEDLNAGGPRFVAAGRSGSADNWDAAIWTSDDARRWEVERVAADANQEIAGLTRVNGGVLAVGWDDSRGDKDVAMWQSEDMRGWGDAELQADEAGDEVVYRLNTIAGGLLLASGWHTGEGDDDAAVWTIDADAMSAERVDNEELGGSGRQHMNRIVRVPDTGTLVGVGVDGDDAGVWLSEDDGESWRRAEAQSSLGGAGKQDIWDATPTADDDIIAVGREQAGNDMLGVTWHTSDGETWERGEPIDEDAPVQLRRVFWLQRPAPDGTTLVVTGLVGNNAAVWRSRDGTSWQRDSDPSGDFESDAAGLRAMRSRDYPLIAVGASGSQDDEDAGVWIRKDE